MRLRSKRPRYRGYVLIEAMITIVVVSLGLLTVAGLLINSLKGNASAASRTQATMLAEDILDRMRANRTAAVVGASPSITSPYNLLIGAAAPTISANSSVALRDLKDWRDSILASLPNGAGGVSVSASTGMVTITITWDDTNRRSAATSIANSGRLVMEARL